MQSSLLLSEEEKVQECNVDEDELKGETVTLGFIGERIRCLPYVKGPATPWHSVLFSPVTVQKRRRIQVDPRKEPIYILN